MDDKQREETSGRSPGVIVIRISPLENELGASVRIQLDGQRMNFTCHDPITRKELAFAVFNMIGLAYGQDSHR
jgi:hypothetical protein